MVLDPERKEFVVEAYKNKLYGIPCKHYNRERSAERVFILFLL